MNKIVRANKLRKEIIEHDKRYAKNEPIISDSDYDDLYMELVEIERTLAEDSIPEDSPTKKIYTILVDALEKVTHPTPMLSLDKVRTEEDLIKFFKKMVQEILAQEKLDGLTVVLTYENGLLVQAVTRGNGKIGEDVTHNILTINSLPKRIPFEGKLVVRAEAIIPLKEFERIIETEDYANPRNLASGTVRQLDATIANKRNLDAIIFEAVEIEGENFQYDTERLEFLKGLGFKVVNYEVFDNQQALIDYCMAYNKDIRKTLNHLVDGLVLKLNTLSERDKLGTTSKHPRWACAFKFEAVEAVTYINDVTFQVGKTGAVTPVAELEPVELDGSTISRATLHNMDVVREKDFKIGDKVIIIKSGDVIPKVVKVILEERDEDKVRDIEITHCPDCGSILRHKMKADGEKTSDLFCGNVKCPSQVMFKIAHFVSRDAMNIDGLGGKTIETLIENNLIEDITDLYSLEDKESEFVVIDGFGQRKFEKIINGLEESKNKPFSNVLYALSINNIGLNTSELIAKIFKDMDDLLKSYEEDASHVKFVVENLEGVGAVVAKSLVDYLDSNKGIIQNLLDYGFTMKEDIVEVSTNNKIADKKFVVTGSLEHFENRKAIKADIKKNGGKSVGSVSSKTDYLINNDVDSTSSKNKTAKKLGIPIITEEEYIDMRG